MADVSRIEEDILRLKTISEPCEAGIMRIGLTAAYRLGADYIKSRMAQAGLSVREDSVGNVYGRLEGEAGLPAVLSGSHLDTVRCAGAYDGVAGVVCALEAARMLVENGMSLRHPFEVLATVEEEGTRFGQVLLGSQFISGVFGEKEMDVFRDDTGVSLRNVLESYLPRDTCPSRRNDDEILAFLELHDEQGPILEAEGFDIGAVGSIVAISWLTVTVSGFAGHAGTVPMSLRRDAAAGACRLIDSIISHTSKNYPYRATATVGKLELSPGSSNCIPSKCTFTVDLRSGEIACVDELTDFIRTRAASIGEELNVDVDVRVDSRKLPVEMDRGLRSLIHDACRKLNLSCRDIDSGAGHDAMIFAARWRAAMLFVPCMDGITHNPAEFVAPEALARGTDVLYRVILSINGISAD